MPERWLVIMLKEPHPGRVKTRLGQGIGQVRAAWWFRHQSARLIRRLGNAAPIPAGARADRRTHCGSAPRSPSCRRGPFPAQRCGPCWTTVLAVSPDAEGLASRVWPSALARIPQGRGDLGARMAGIFRRLPPGPVVIIGADIPAITPAHIARAFAALGRHDAVFGPARDGGYWLVGMKRSRALPRSLFARVRWSGEHALADTLATVGGLSVGFIDELADVDRATDLPLTRRARRGKRAP